jgi:hypothetical protein
MATPVISVETLSASAHWLGRFIHPPSFLGWAADETVDLDERHVLPVAPCVDGLGDEFFLIASFTAAYPNIQFLSP